MVFYYKDLGISNKINDWLIPALSLIIILIPIFIYIKQYQIALWLSALIGIIQICAMAKNVKKYPL